MFSVVVIRVLLADAIPLGLDKALFPLEGGFDGKVPAERRRQRRALCIRVRRWEGNDFGERSS
jgi:hypothetical protein